MKLRILDNNIRLRLNQSEVEEFGKYGKVVSKIEFGTQQLNYQLHRTNSEDVLAEYSSDTITIHVPDTVADKWLQLDAVGFSNQNQSTIKILIEKDFQCLHKRPDEDEADSFPNPSAQ